MADGISNTDAGGSNNLDEKLKNVIEDESDKDHDFFRDRAAYVYITGSYPTHLRRFFTALLRKVTQYSREPASLDGTTGSMKMDPYVVRRLALDDHPMVRKVRDYVEEGYHIHIGRALGARRPYSKVLLYMVQGDDIKKITVQSDGSVKDGWG